MNKETRHFNRAFEFGGYFLLTSSCAAFAYLCRFHVFGFDESGYIFWKLLLLTIVAIVWIIVRLIAVMME